MNHSDVFLITGCEVPQGVGSGAAIAPRRPRADQPGPAIALSSGAPKGARAVPLVAPLD